MEIRTGRPSTQPSKSNPTARPVVAPVLALAPTEGKAPEADVVSRTVGAVLNQVVDLLDSVAAGVESNRANRRPPVSDQRLFAGASAVVTDLVEHTRIGEERPLVGDARPRLVYGGAAPAASSRAWVAETRQQIAGLRSYLDKVASAGLGQVDAEALGEWRGRMAELASVQAPDRLDLTA